MGIPPLQGGEDVKWGLSLGNGLSVREMGFLGGMFAREGEKSALTY